MVCRSASAASCSPTSEGDAIASVFVVSGPSGAGKGTVIALVKQRVDHVVTSVSATTRAPRPGEQDGREYHYLTRAEFERRVAAGEFLEWVEYSGDLYGTLRAEVDGRLAAGDDVILEIELVGARAVRKVLPQAVAVFIAPPSMAELTERLRGRGTETDEAIARRLHIAETEVAAASEFDRVVVNDDAARAADEVAAIIEDRRKGRWSASPRIDELLPEANGSRYQLVMIAAKRARQINSYYHSLGENTLGIEELTPPLITTRSTNLLTIALEEVADGKIEYESPE